MDKSHIIFCFLEEQSCSTLIVTRFICIQRCVLIPSLCCYLSLTKVFLLTYYATYQSTTIPIEGVRFYPLVAGSFLSIFFFCCVATVTGLFIVCTMPGGKPSELLCGFGVLPLVRAVILAVLCAGFSSLLLGYLLRKPYTRLGHVSCGLALNSHIAHGMIASIVCLLMWY